MDICFNSSINVQFLEKINEQIEGNPLPYKGLQTSLILIPSLITMVIETIARSIFALLTLPAAICYANSDENIFNANIEGLKDTAEYIWHTVQAIFVLPFMTDDDVSDY